MRATSWDFSLFHAWSLIEDSNKSAHLAVSLEPLPSRKCEFVYRKVLLSFRIAVQIRRFGHTGWSNKESLDVSCIYLFIYLFFYFLLYLDLFYSFFVRVSLECKDVEDGGSISVYQAASCWTVYFHQEPVLDQTMTNLQQNTIGLKLLDFNRILF